MVTSSHEPAPTAATTGPALIGALIDALGEDRDAQWSALSVVVELYDGQVCGSYGYAYGEQVLAVSADPEMIEAAVGDYLASYLRPGVALPVKLLSQYDRTAGTYLITWEDTDPERWNVTPRNIATIREDLRPRLA